MNASKRKFCYAQRTTEEDRGQAGDQAGDCQPADTDREATDAEEVQRGSARTEKKSLLKLPKERRRYQRMSAQQKEEVIKLVERSQLPINQTLRKLHVPTRTYYRWTGNGCLEDEPPVARRIWNKLLPKEEETVIQRALEHPDRSARQLAFLITDEGKFSVSESTIYRILKREGLIRELPQVIKASKEYHRKTTRVHEMWQTDFTYFYIVNWGWYFAGGVLDDFSRYSICFELMPTMDGTATQKLIEQAIRITGMKKVPVRKRVKLLSDNGSGYIAKPFNLFLEQSGIHHIYTARNHPQTNGKIERLNRTAKERLNLVVYTSPSALQEALNRFRDWYNTEHYHKSIGNLHPADVYHGRAEAILKRRKRLQSQTKKTRRQVNTKTQPKPQKLRNLRTQPTP
jgi:putative transposase